MFDEFIKEKLMEVKCVIVLWSRDSVKSRWVKDEAGRSEDKLIPVLIDNTDIPLGFGMLQTAQLIDWKGDLADPDFKLLLESVSGFLGHPIVIEIEKEEKTFTNSIGMKFVLILAGEFEMGSPLDEEGRWDDEGPVHHVKITKSFFFGFYHVTQKEWKAVTGKNPSYFKGDDLPVENVSWDDVQEFIKKLNEKENTNKYCLQKQNGNMQPGQALQHDIPLVMMNRNWVIMRGMLRIQAVRRIRSKRRSQIPGDFTIYTVMSGSGCRIHITIAMTVRQQMAVLGKVEMAPIGSFAAAAGISSQSTAGRRTAAASTPATATTASAFAS